MSRRNRTRMMLFPLLLGLACVACDLQQDISFDEPKDAPQEGLRVSVVWEENEPDGADVFLDTLEKVVVEERTVWVLWDILLAAGLEQEEIFSMRFDFESADGFRPSSKGCAPLEGEDLALGYLDTEDLSLSWDSSLGLRGCYWVTQLARILGEPE